MTVSLKHKFQSAKADGSDASLLRPSNWNEEHDLTLAGSRLLGRSSSSSGAAQEIPLGNGLEFVGGALLAKIGAGLTFESGAIKLSADAVSAASIAAAIVAATAKTTLLGADSLALVDSAASNALKEITLANFWKEAKWRIFPVGAMYMVDTSIVGVEVPPIADTESVWVELTAGLTGAGGFNNSKLTTEVVSGAAPLISATAVVAVAGSPINGQIIDLLNTEGRILRPSLTPGTKQNDALQGHKHTERVRTSSPGSYNDGPPYGSGGGDVANSSEETTSPVTDGTNGTPRTANETRMKNVGVRAYMRVK